MSAGNGHVDALPRPGPGGAGGAGIEVASGGVLVALGLRISVQEA